MCGIVGTIGTSLSRNILLNGLQRLEYRGYDSAGIYLQDGDEGELVKSVGKIADLESIISKSMAGTIGIAHTRWATHGQPSIENAHPQFSTSERFYLVHNGVISNFKQLKDTELSNTIFKSVTDTEVIVQLIAKFVEQEGLSTLAAFEKTLKMLQGSYALILVDKENPEQLYVAKNKSPLLIGLAEDFNIVTSDALATYDVTDQYIELNDSDFAVVTKEQVAIFDQNNKPIDRLPITIKIDGDAASKGAFETFMLKEINEQPAVMHKIAQHYLNENGQPQISAQLLAKLAESDRIYFVAAGTSYHASLIGKRLFERFTELPAEVAVASEFGYHWPIMSRKPFFIFLSQSGETADSRQVLIEAKRRKYPTLVLTNVENSTLSREADYMLGLYAGPEIAVASTKAYTAQIAVESVLAKALGDYRGIAAAEDFDVRLQLSLAADGITQILTQKDRWSDLTTDFIANQRDAFYLGRGVDSDVSLEAALKMKEISYVHTEGFAAGELKHGTIALIEAGVPVIFFITEKSTAAHTRGNVQEVKARGGHVLIISTESTKEEGDQVVLVDLIPELMPLVTVVVGQLLAYFATLQRGLNVDQPRNLAKSVTVE